MRFIFLLVFCALSFDCLATLREEEEIAPFLNLDKLSYKKTVITAAGVPATFKVPLVEKYVSLGAINREEELEKCQYLTGEELQADWENFASGDREWINQSRVISFDTEVNNTTFEGEVIQISLFESINGKNTGLVFNTFIRPRSKKFSYYSSKVHGITYNDLQKKPYFSQISQQLFNFIGNSVVVAHNASFDIRMLTQEYERLQQTSSFTFYYKCTMQMHRRDKRRDVQNIQIPSPFKIRSVQFIPDEERAEIIRKKRERTRRLKIRRELKRQKRENALRKTGSSPQTKTQKAKTETSSSLGHFIKTRDLNAGNIEGILEIKRQRGKKQRIIGHHDALFDTLVLRSMLESFNQKKIEEDIRFSQENQEGLDNDLTVNESDDDFLTQDENDMNFSNYTHPT